MKNIKIAAFALLSLFAMANAKAEEKTEGFEDVSIVDANGNAVSGNYTAGTGLSNGWIVSGGGICAAPDYSNYGLWTTKYSGSKSLTAQYGSSNAGIIVIPEQLSGNFTFYARKSSSSSSTKGYVYIYEMEEDGGSFKKGATLLNSPTLTTTWTKYTVDLGEDPHYVGINMIRAGIDEIVYNTYEAAAGPRLQVLQGGKAVKSGAAYNFGLVAEDATVEYTIKNAGTETMNATLACTGAYSVSDASVSLAADAEKTVTITLSASALGSQEGALTISPEGLDAFTINLAGIVRDPAKLYVDFSEAPADWTLNGWTINAGGYATIGSNYYYSNTSISSNKALQTSLLKVEEGEKLFIRYRKNYNSTSSYYNGILCFWASTDGTTWTKVGDNVTATEYNVWNETTISGFPTSTKYVAISGQYIDIDDFYGFALSADPVMTIEGETVTDNAITQNFGKCKADATKTYTIKNIGGGALHVDLANSNTTDFTISETSLDVAAGESATFDLTFNFSTEYGTKTSAVTLTPNAGDVVTINVAAAAQDPEEFTEDFEDGIPAGWTNKGWAIENAPSYGNGTKMVYSGYSNTNTLLSPRLQAKAGDIIEIQALQKWNDEPLTLEYSIDDAETWEMGFSEVPAVNNTLHTLYFTAPSDGIYLLRFSGRYNYIDNICGFKLAQIAEFEITSDVAEKDGEKSFADDLGIVTTEKRHTYTVKNTGTVDITLDLTVVSSDDIISVDPSTLTVPMGESKTFDVVATNTVSGETEAVITIKNNRELPDYTIHATAFCPDPATMLVDFESGIPGNWTNEGWTIQTQNGSKMAYSYASDDNKLTTPLLQATKYEKLSFDAFQKWDDEPLKLEYSLDYGHTWVTAFEEAPAANNTSKSFTFLAPQAGKYMFRFSGSYNYIDNVIGFKVVEPSELELKAVDSDNLHYATFSSTEDVIFAKGVTVSTVSVVDHSIVMTEVENGYVPANTGVVITSKDATAKYSTMSAASQISEDNMLRAASVAMTGDYKFYKLAYNDFTAKTDLGFYWGAADGAAFAAKAGGAYLAIPVTLASVKGFAFIGDTDAIREVQNDANRVIYNIKGQRMQHMQKGLNIVNGKKIMVK